MIFKYNQFLREKIEVSQTDDPDVASKKNYLNDLEVWIKEFQQKRTDMDNIYLTYIDEDDLIDKLSARGFMDKTDNKKKMEFKNPLFSIYSSACEKSRQLKNLEKEIDELTDKTKDKKEYIQKNPSSGDNEDVKSELTTIKQQQSDKSKLIQKLSKEIVEIKRVTNERLKEMRQSFIDANKQVRND